MKRILKKKWINQYIYLYGSNKSSSAGWTSVGTFPETHHLWSRSPCSSSASAACWRRHKPLHQSFALSWGGTWRASQCGMGTAAYHQHIQKDPWWLLPPPSLLDINYTSSAKQLVVWILRFRPLLPGRSLTRSYKRLSGSWTLPSPPASHLIICRRFDIFQFAAQQWISVAMKHFHQTVAHLK